MPSLLFFAVLFGFIAWLSAYTMRPQKDVGIVVDADDERLESVAVCYRKERFWVAGLLTLAPAIALIRVSQEYAKPDHGSRVADFTAGLTSSSRTFVDRRSPRESIVKYLNW